MKSTQNSTLLELHVPDFDVVKLYYGKIGFEVVWERMPEGKKGYLVMRMENNILCFWCGNNNVYQQEYFKQFLKETKRGYGVEIVLIVSGLEAYYERVKAMANVVEELTMQPWGLKDFRAVDPFGYYLRFSPPHDILSDENAVK